MATAVLTNVPTTISLAESTTGWTGDTFDLEPDIKVQGSNSVACAMTNNGSNEIYYTGFTAADLSSVHLRLWFNITFIGNLATTNQIQVFISDGTNTAYWTIQNPGAYAGGWSQAVIYTGNTPTSGTKPIGNSTRVGMRFTTASKPRNVPANAWFDAWYFGDGYTVTGGTSGDEISWADVAALDLAQAYGVVSEVDGVYFLVGDIDIGSGATTTYWKEAGEICVFKDLPVNSILYRLQFQGSACYADLAGGVYSVAGTTLSFTLLASSGMGSFDLTGKQISRYGLAIFSDSTGGVYSITNCVFNDGQSTITPNLATFELNTISNNQSANEALLFPSDDSYISSLQFINNNNAVEYGSTSDSTDPTFNNFTFDDVAGQYDVNNTSGGAVTINLSNGSNANSYNPGGSVVTFSSPVVLTITGLPINTELTIVNSSTRAELYHVENTSGPSEIYNYGASEIGVVVDILCVHVDYDPHIGSLLDYTLSSGDSTLPVALVPDPTYSNP